MKLMLLLLLSNSLYAETYAQHKTALDAIHEKYLYQGLQVSAFADYYDAKLVTEIQSIPCKNKSDTDLINSIELLYLISFYTQRQDITSMYLHCFERLRERKLTTSNGFASYSVVYEILFKNRMFAQAQAFYEKYKAQDLTLLPTVSGSIEKSADYVIVYALDAKQENLIKQKLFYPNFTGILVESNHGCGFCRYAAKAISADAQLLKFMAQHSVWLEPPHKPLQFQYFQQWNQKYPQLALRIIENSSDFNDLNFEGTPAFHFIKQGKYVEKLVGWPQAGQMHELKALIAKHFAVEL